MENNKLKSEIITECVKYLPGSEIVAFNQLTKNNYYKFVKPEMVFQSLFCSILRANNIKYVLPQTESRKTPFERYLYEFSGKYKGVPDVFILSDKNKGIFVELKKETPFKLNGELKKNKHLQDQYNFLENAKKQGYKAFFCYPGNLETVLKEII